MNTKSLLRSTVRSATVLLLMAVTLVNADPQDAKLQQIRLPAGFTIEVLPFALPNARQMALTEAGTLIVGTRREGVVYAVPDALTGEAGQPLIIARGLTMPSGVAVSQSDLYIAATHEVLLAADIDDQLKQGSADIKLRTITDQLPDKRHHGWKYIKFSPTGELFVPVGAPCNICLSDDPRFASLLAMDPGTGTTSIWAEGLRNTVGFAWHPRTAHLWISDNGRDMLGDDIPAEEINVATGSGMHFGYPFVHASGLDDPEFGDHKARGSRQFTPPTVEIQAHSAALGMTFYTGNAFPDSYRNGLFIAEHGSWNRSSKVGYRISLVTATDTDNPQYRLFAEGWLQGEKNWGRPNDVLITPAGNLLISDDQLGVVYRVSYQGTL